MHYNVLETNRLMKLHFWPTQYHIYTSEYWRMPCGFKALCSNLHESGSHLLTFFPLHLYFICTCAIISSHAKILWHLKPSFMSRNCSLTFWTTRYSFMRKYLWASNSWTLFHVSHFFCLLSHKSAWISSCSHLYRGEKKLVVGYNLIWSNPKPNQPNLTWAQNQWAPHGKWVSYNKSSLSSW